jgi:hypothetical protein
VPRANGGAVVTRVEGLYADLLAAARLEVERGDPRVPYISDDPAERRKLNARSPCIRQAQRRVEAMEAGESVIIPRSGIGVPTCFPEARNVPWLNDRFNGVSLIRVSSGDLISPTERHRNGH